MRTALFQFFPSSCRPVRVEILYDRRTKRPNGDGYAYFISRAQVYEAKKCDRQYMSKDAFDCQQQSFERNRIL